MQPASCADDIPTVPTVYSPECGQEVGGGAVGQALSLNDGLSNGLVPLHTPELLQFLVRKNVAIEICQHSEAAEGEGSNNLTTTEFVFEIMFSLEMGCLQASDMGFLKIFKAYR